MRGADGFVEGAGMTLRPLRGGGAVGSANTFGTTVVAPSGEELDVRPLGGPSGHHTPGFVPHPRPVRQLPSRSEKFADYVHFCLW